MIDPLILRPDESILTRYPQLVKMAAELSEIYADREKLVTDNALQLIGTLLWRALDADEPFQQARKRAGQHLLPIVIESGNPEILHLPWETLCHPESGFLGRSEGFTLSRAMPSSGAVLPAIEEGPLRVLLFTALPDDIGEKEQLRIEDEQALVLEALGQWRQSGHAVLEMPDDGRFSEFTHQLHHFRPHLVYLSGHGVFYKDYLNPENDRGYFLFESDNDGGELVDEEQLAAAFTGTTVQAVILSACHSGKASSASLNNGLMQRLADKGIPHVIGMRESILDRAGLQFARAFFGALMQQQSIAASLQQARRAIVRPLHDDEELRHSPLAELSLGQWCLPMLLSHQCDRQLVTGRFTPQPMRPANLFNESLNNISLPAHFIGRRRELRRRQRAFREGTSALLMLTGAGGMGKTALAGKLLTTPKADGYEIFAFSARPEHNWRDTVLQMELALDEIRVAKYSKIQQVYAEKSKQIEMLLKLLLEQFGSQVALFFDNLESLQDATTRALTDPELQLLIDAAVRLKKQDVKGLRVVLTSRWALPEWREQLYPLGKPVYRDFLAVAQQQKLPKEFLTDFKRLRQAYNVLGGNYRALEFFAAALQKMNTIEEEQLVASLRKATEEIQTNMLLELVYTQREPAEQQLLKSLVAYEVPVAFEGVKALVLDELEQPESALDALLSVSLIERTENKSWQAEEFLVSPLVRDWLLQQKRASVSREQLHRAAGYLQWLLENERGTVEQAIITYAALIAAGMNEEAYRITLNWIVGPMNLAGLYQALLDTWLPSVCSSTRQTTLAAGFGQIGKQYLHIAQYDTALDYLKRSLAIQQEIGDKSGEGTTLNNISQIFKARGDYDTALDYLKRSLAISQEIGDKSGEGTTLNNIAGIYRARGDYDTALDYLKRSLAISQEIGDKSGEGTTLNNISQIFKARGDYDTALDYLKRSLAISQEIGDKSGEGTTLNNISALYHARGDYDTALDYLKRSLAISQEIGDKSGEGTMLNNISQIYDARGDYDTALDYLKRSLAISQEIGDKSREGTTLNNISQIFKARGDYDTALDYLKRSLAIRQEIGDSAGLCATLFNMGHIYLQNEEGPNAITSWVTVYRMAKPMNLAQVLQALENLALQLGLQGGLDGWEQLSQQMGEGE
jgi:tetratricopeptide (TPR) repeat protein